MAREKGTGTGPFEVKTPTGAIHYRVAVTMADGRRVWRTRPTRALAERARKQLVEARELDLDPTRQTLSEWLRSWLAGLGNARNQRVRPRTLDHYTLVVEKHIIPGLDPTGKRDPKQPDEPPPKGSLKLSMVTGRKVQAWLDADPAAPRTVRHHHAVLRRALNVAVRQRLLAYNPAAAVELPDVDSDIAKPLTLDEARKLLEATRKDRLYPLWRLALVTGLRQGELLGLTWEDVNDVRRTDPGTVAGGQGEAGGIGGAVLRGDVAGGQGSAGVQLGVATLTVRAQLQRLTPERGGDARGWARTPPKAARKVTRIALDPDTAAALDAHRKAMAAERTPDWLYYNMVFVNEHGRPFHAADIRTLFGAACRKAGIAERRFHDLRGTSATLMREAGVTEDTRMARLGHSSVSMARHYAQASEEQDRIAVNKLADRLSNVG